MKYYDLKRNWTKKVLPHLKHPEVKRVLARDMNKYLAQWGKTFKHGDAPQNHFDGCDWGWDHRGRRPRFWAYTFHRACHWLVNFNLELAMRVEPSRTWRILTSDKHSTVWDGKETLCSISISNAPRWTRTNVLT
jgi:hypothetical protein